MAEPYLQVLTNKVEHLELSIPENVLLEYKHFFSGAALYVNGKICASLSPAGFGLNLPGDVRNRLIKEGGGSELRYFEKAPVKKGYVALAPQVVQDHERLGSLLSMSISYVLESA